METEQIFPGVWEFRTTYGRDTAELFTDGAMPHAAWFVAGEHPTILDPGPTSIAEELLDAIRALGHETDDIEWIVPSHIHIDHAGGCGWLVRELPQAKAVFHTRGAPFMRDTLPPHRRNRRRVRRDVAGRLRRDPARAGRPPRNGGGRRQAADRRQRLSHRIHAGALARTT